MTNKINTIKSRIENLRKLMKRDNIDAYIVLSDDFHSSEYVGDYFKCREFITGFTGSAGTAVFTEKEAGLWTDGRYYLQAEEQLKGTGIDLYKMENTLTIKEFLSDRLKPGMTVGYDGRTMSYGMGCELREFLKDKDIRFVNDIDLIGEIWKDRPDFPNSKVWELPIEYAGESRESKLSRIRERMKEKNADVHLIASPDDIAWTYNLRGNDILYNPVFISYSLVFKDRAIIYRNPESFDKTGTLYESEGKKDDSKIIEIRDYDRVYDDVKKLENLNILVDCSSVNERLYGCIKANVISVMKPATEFKAVKNEVETENVRHAHVLDGVALTKLIYRLKNKRDEMQKADEMSVAKELIALRKENESYLEESFEPIIASGSHGAIIHYSATEKSNKKIEDNTFLLMDTGGQYLYGTTDVTRTIAISKVTDEMKKHYTSVLKGHLALGHAKFKEGTTGVNLDYLARKPLWELGLDYRHGTGHGVGYLLNVHEGPNNISLKRRRDVDVPFAPGMITSNEPGVYIEGKYGIRTENLILCTEDEMTEYGRFYRFETLTLVPYDTDAIDFEMLTEEEKNQIREYHGHIYEKISPYLNVEEKEWLKKLTEAV